MAALSRLYDAYSRLPVFVGASPLAGGRGLFARRRLLAGEKVLTEHPLSCHPTDTQATCLTCLRSLPDERVGAHGRSYCGTRCSETRLSALLRSPSFARFEAGVRLAASPASGDLLLPVLCVRFALSSAAKKTASCHFEGLCLSVIHPPERPPRAWETAAADAKALLAEHGVNVSAAWFLSALSRVHANAFRVSRSPSSGMSNQQQTRAGAGTAVYGLSSYANHSCDPTCDVSWPNDDAEIAFSARHDIHENEEVTISYVDARKAVAVRRESLLFGYGFRCTCHRCMAELAQEALETLGSPLEMM